MPDTKDLMNGMLNDLVRRGGNREAVVWLAAGLGNAIARYRRDPVGAIAALNGVREFAVKIGLARRLDEVVLLLGQQQAA